MTEVTLLRVGDGFVPFSEDDAKNLKRWKTGDLATFNFKKPRNSKFLSKFFSMLDHAYETWSPEPIEGHTPVKDKKRFRGEMLILAGFRKETFNYKGEVRYDPVPINFSDMPDDVEFEKVYNAVAQVILERILTNYTLDDLNSVVMQRMMGYLT